MNIAEFITNLNDGKYFNPPGFEDTADEHALLVISVAVMEQIPLGEALDLVVEGLDLEEYEPYISYTMYGIVERLAPYTISAE